MPFTFTALAIAVVCTRLSCSDDATPSRKYLWLAIWFASLIAALAAGIVTATGALFAGAFGGAVFAFYRAKTSWSIAFAATVTLAMTAGLMLHRLPGFHNPKVIDAVRFTPDARPFTLYLNFDKTLIGLFILGWGHQRITRLREWKNMLAIWLPWTCALVLVLMILSLAMGYIRFAPKCPPESWLWLAANLFFVCTAEEALFRGFVQAQLERLWSSRRSGAPAALIVAALLFGLSHFWGGWAYVALATVAGLGYGWIYRRTQRIEASILAHFALNAAHFFLFTYPALA